MLNWRAFRVQTSLRQGTRGARAPHQFSAHPDAGAPGAWVAQASGLRWGAAWVGAQHALLKSRRARRKERSPSGLAFGSKLATTSRYRGCRDEKSEDCDDSTSSNSFFLRLRRVSYIVEVACSGSASRGRFARYDRRRDRDCTPSAVRRGKAAVLTALCPAPPGPQGQDLSRRGVNGEHRNPACEWSIETGPHAKRSAFGLRALVDRKRKPRSD